MHEHHKARTHAHTHTYGYTHKEEQEQYDRMCTNCIPYKLGWSLRILSNDIFFVEFQTQAAICSPTPLKSDSAVIQICTSVTYISALLLLSSAKLYTYVCHVRILRLFNDAFKHT